MGATVVTWRKPAGDGSAEAAARVELTVTLQTGEPYTFTLADVTDINDDDLLGEILGHPTRYAFYAMLHVQVKDQLRKAKRALAGHARRAALFARADLAGASGEKKVKETLVKERVAASSDHERLQEAVDDLETLEDRVAAVREALVHRRDCLTSASMFRAPERGASIADRARFRLERDR